MADSSGLHQLGIAGRRVPFDADLGPNARGGVSAVYSRCRTEPRLTDSRTQLPAYFQARGCRLYELDLASHRERRVGLLSRTGYSEFLPSLWKGNVAFAMRKDVKRADVVLRRASLRTGRVVSIAAGPRHATARTGALPGDVDPGPLSLDLRGLRVGYTWGSDPARCANPPSDSDKADAFRVDLITVDRRRAIVQSDCNYDDRAELVGAALGAGTISTVVEQFAGAGVFGTTFLRFRDATAEHTAPGPTNVIAMTVTGDDVLYVTQPVDGSALEIVRGSI